MVEPIKSVYEQALQLQVADRAALIHQLIASLDGADIEQYQADDERFHQDPEIEKAWEEEIKRRIEKMDRGEMKMVSWEQVREQARKIIDG